MARKTARHASAALLLYLFSTGCVPAPAENGSPGKGGGTVAGSGGRAGSTGGSPAAGATGGAGTATGGRGSEPPAGTGGAPAGATGGRSGTGGSSGSGGVQGGSPDGSPPPPDLAPSTTAPKLSTDVFPIVKEKCARAGCHDPIKHEHGMNLSTPELVHMLWVNAKTNDHCMRNASVTRVTPGKPESSFVVTLIKNDTTRCSEQRRMPPAPLPVLSAAEVKTITDWVAAGALKD